jgi:hypothetical protein
MPAVRSRRGGDLPQAKPRSDAYVGMLAISLLVLGTAMLFAFLDKSTYPDTSPPKVQVAPRAAQGTPPVGAPVAAPSPAPGIQGGQQGVPPQVAPPPGGQVPPKQ